MVTKAKNKDKKVLWSEIKRELTQYKPAQLLEMVSALYSLSTENKRFIEAKVVNDDNILEKYREIISRSISTEAPWLKSHQLSLKTAKKAISDYKKATGNIEDTIDLMIYYVERGTQFTLEFGDIDESFYNSMESMFESILKLMSSNSYQAGFLTRLESIVKESRDMGWGYYDNLNYMLEKWQQQKLQTLSSSSCCLRKTNVNY